MIFAPFFLDKKQLKQVAVHTLLVSAAATIAYILSLVSPEDFGIWNGAVVTLLSISLKGLQKLMESDHKLSALSVNNDSWSASARDD